ncbi:MAG TPA: exonuclease SbcCD subunit D [Pseudogracilibacillus sp.]|nr:exonuclease SbcCD subunit D [Pseudogracilibacillus sp.]
MKIFHTADWHLGKVLQGVSMTEDQAYILKEFVEQVKLERPHCVIVAGDLYDRTLPPTEAVQLLNEVLETIVLDLEIPVLAIAGNHDSPSRLDFGSKMMEAKGFYVVGEYDAARKPTVLHDEHGEVHVHLVPFTDPSIVRHVLQDETVRNHDDAMRAIVENIEQTKDEQARHVFVGHAFVTAYGEEEENTCESERPIAIGGAEYVSSRHLQDFDYVALGHLHQAHRVKEEHIRYAGSPLKYSKSEANHEKGFYIVELAADGETTIEKRTLTPRRDVRVIRATMDEILSMPESDDYVFVELTDDAAVLSPMEKVRTVFPNAMHIERTFFGEKLKVEQEERIARQALSDEELFAAFYEEVKGFKPSNETTTIFNEALSEWMQKERETSPVKK